MKHYDPRAIARYFLYYLLMMLAMKTTGGAGFGLMIPVSIFVFATNKPSALFFCLMLTIVSVMGNPHFFPKGSIYAYEQRFMMVVLGVVMSTQIVGRTQSPLLTPLLMIIPYILFMALTAAEGWCPVVSWLKLFLFTAVLLAYFGAANRMVMSSHQHLSTIRNIFLSVAIFFIVGSTLLIPFPGISQVIPEKFMLEDGISLFAGMGMHSQSLGPVIASLGAVLFSDMLFGVRRMTRLYVGLLTLCPLLIYKTSCRTALGAFGCGIIFTLYFFLKARGVQSRWKQRIINLSLVMGIVACLGVLFLPSLRDGVSQFLLKWHGPNSTGQITYDELMSSRRSLMDRSIYNFQQSPIIGNGFQVSEEMSYLRDESFLRLLTAPIEKGVWTLAILEEGGVIGMFLFVLFLIKVFTSFVKRKAYVGAAAFVVLLTSNFGEFTFFSVSYTGGFLWTMVFVGIVLDAHRLKMEQMAKAYVGARW